MSTSRITITRPSVLVPPVRQWGFSLPADTDAKEKRPEWDVFPKEMKTNNVHLKWWLLPDLNWGHKALQASALPTELKSHISNERFHYTG